MVIISGVPIFRIFTVCSISLISVDPAQYEIFRAKFAISGKDGISENSHIEIFQILLKMIKCVPTFSRR